MFSLLAQWMLPGELKIWQAVSLFLKYLSSLLGITKYFYSFVHTTMILMVIQIPLQMESNEWMLRKATKVQVCVQRFSLFYQTWEDLLKFDTTAGYSYHWKKKERIFAVYALYILQWYLHKYSVLPIVYWYYVSPTQPSLHLLWRCLMSSQNCGRGRRLGVALPQASTTMHTPHWVRFTQVSSLCETWTSIQTKTVYYTRFQFLIYVTYSNVLDLAYCAVHALALQFTGSAIPPNVYLMLFYIGVLPGLPPR